MVARASPAHLFDPSAAELWRYVATDSLAQSTMTESIPYGLLRITVENTEAVPVTLILEPWASEYTMNPGERFIIEGNGPVEYATFQVERRGTDLMVTSWDGSDVRILRPDGSIIEDWSGNPVPNFREMNRQRRAEPWFPAT
jgi:hypothetical protein